MTVKPGDRVLFGKYGGVEIIVGREKILTLRQDDIIAILVEEADPL
jgi:co-chaperonin GroES (HSP10)